MQVQRSLSFARGLTLIEACATLAIASVLAGTAVPAFDKFQTRRVLEGMAAEALIDMHYARSEAVARNQRARISYLGAPDGARCMVTYIGTATNCTCEGGGVSQCEAGVPVLKTHSYPASAKVAITSNVGSMVVDPVRGTFSPAGKLQVVLKDGTEVHHVVNPAGRIRTYSPDGMAKGYPLCRFHGRHHGGGSAAARQ
jgi:type IV fimbrial biogenesis protein FimT